MMLSKSRLFASSLAIAALGAVGLGYAAPHLGKSWLPRAAQSAQTQPEFTPVSPVAVAEAGTRVDTPDGRANRDVRVNAPGTAVRVDKDSGKVAVRAPYTDVKVDPDKGQVRVRAPYVNLDIRW